MQRLTEVPWSRPPLRDEKISELAADDHEGEVRSTDAPSWRVHDRTHLELTVAYPSQAGRMRWEAYFFAPESFRLDKATYDKDEIYSDFKSYVRLMVDAADLDALSGAPIDNLERRLGQLSPENATREIRLLGCRIRRSCVKGVRDIEELLERDGPGALAAIDRWLEGVRVLMDRLREVVSGYVGKSEVAEALRWIDEDASLLVETQMGELVLMLRTRLREWSGARIAALTARAVGEARYRRDQGYESVVGEELDDAEIERIEFRRHMLKRFAASALWLSTEVYKPGTWAEHTLFALAASVAMAFAMIAAVWNGQPAQEQLPVWLGIAVVAYAIKDRMKAALQDRFRSVLERYFPDRRWKIIDQHATEIARMDEDSRFRAFERLPADVLEARRRTRRHPIEEQARPETVLWHAKSMHVDGSQIAERYDGVLEVFRLDLSRWLTHTDDPKTVVTLADPERGELREIVAPRVYNIAVVYRVSHGDIDGPWHRVRVVVSRKGIRRIDHIA